MIALTGYSGFVGQQLLAKLSKSDCLLLGRKKPFGDYRYCDLDLASIDKRKLHLSLKPVTTVIHLAARVHVLNEKAHASLAEFRRINTEATLTLAIQAAQAGVKRFIFLSSIKVNGEATSNSKRFTYQDKPAPAEAYGLSKAEAEQQLIKLGEQTGMEIVIIRSPLVYGEGVKENFASLMQLVSKGLPLPFGLIKHNKRSMVSVYNLVDLITVCITHPSAAGQIFLISDDDDLSTAQTVALMAKVQGKKNLILPVPLWCFRIAGKLLNKNDIVDRLTGSLQLDISHTKNTLDWAPPYSVEYGFSLAAKQE